jgi:drug/metabolite transporter (DMT)-like permease
MSRRHLLMLLALSALWGASFMLIKVGVRDFSPATLVWLRLTVAAATLAPIALLSAGRSAFAELRAEWRGLAVMGTANSAIPFWFLSWGETRIDSGLAAIIQASAPIFTALLAWRFSHSERVSGARLAGVLVGFAGVALLVGGQRGGAVLGALAVLVTAFCYAASALWGGRRLAHVAPLTLALGTMTTGALVTLPFGLAQLPAELPGWKPAASVLALGVGGSALAYLLYYAILLGAGASRVILVTYLVPAAALAYGVALLGEPVQATALGGLALVLAGVALGTGALRPTRRGSLRA